MSRRLVDTGSKPFQSSLLITYLRLSVTIAPKNDFNRMVILWKH